MYIEGTPEVDSDLVLEDPFNWMFHNTGLEQGAHLPAMTMMLK
jgi:hypothetical protein